MKTKEYVGIRQATRGGWIKCEVGGVADFLYPTSTKRRGRVQGDGQVCPTITSENTGVCKVEKNENYNIVDGVLYPEEDMLKDTDSKEMDWENCEYRIRKLTARECFRLMDVTDDDANKMLAINSSTQCYKEAGNSIVCSVLCGIFSQLNIKGVKPWNDRTLEEKYALTALGK